MIRPIATIVLCFSCATTASAGFGDWLTKKLGGEPGFLTRCSYQAEVYLNRRGYYPDYDDENAAAFWVIRSCGCYSKQLDKHNLKNKLDRIVERNRLLVQCIEQKKM